MSVKSWLTCECHPDVVWIRYLLNLFRQTSYIGKTDCGKFSGIVLCLVIQIYRSWCYALWIIVPTESLLQVVHFFLIYLVTADGFCTVLQVTDDSFLNILWLVGVEVEVLSGGTRRNRKIRYGWPYMERKGKPSVLMGGSWNNR